MSDPPEPPLNRLTSKMSTPTPRRSARIAAKAALAEAAAPAMGGAGKPTAKAKAEAKPTAKAEPKPKKPFWGTDEERAAKHTKYQDSITAQYMAMTPEQKAAEFKRQTEIITAAKQIVTDISNPAIPKMSIQERIATVKAIIDRMNSVWNEAIKCIDSNMDIMFITDARSNAYIVIGESEPYGMEGYDYEYDDDFNQVPIPIEQHIRMYCKDAAKLINYFIDGFAPHPALRT